MRHFPPPAAARPGTLLAIVSLLVAPAALLGQYDEPPPPAAWALRGVTVATPQDTLLADVTLVVRDGLIETLSAGAEIPVDARLLEGEGLFVYPGFVDAQGAVDHDFPEPGDLGEDEDITQWNPPRSASGFLPHRRVAEHLSERGEDLSGHRENGVVAAIVHPGGGLAPGQPAAVVLRADADVPRELVHRESLGLTMTLQGAPGVYPSQLFGVIAYLRQAFLDADRYRAVRSRYAADPTGLTPPAWDPDYEALLGASSGEWPVFFAADSDEDIRRVLNLADEFGFRPVLVGGDEAWKLADELAEREVTVLVSLDFPEPDEWDPEADLPDEELEPAASREKERLEAIWSNAGRLEAAGVDFVLTSGGGTGDVLEGMRRAVEYGLSAERALRAVTVDPAGLAGLPGLGSVEEGGAATFVVADGELLDEETGIAYTFVEGHLERGAAAPGAPAEEEGDPPAGDLTGTWDFEVDAGGQQMRVEMVVEQDEEGGLLGTFEGGPMGGAAVSGSISGRDVTLELEPEGIPEPLVLTGTLSEDGDTIEGSGPTPFGEMEFRATRRPGGGIR